MLNYIDDIPMSNINRLASFTLGGGLSTPSRIYRLIIEPLHMITLLRCLSGGCRLKVLLQSVHFSPDPQETQPIPSAIFQVSANGPLSDTRLFRQSAMAN